jgi:FAD:protein FMN transferase
MFLFTDVASVDENIRAKVYGFHRSMCKFSAFIAAVMLFLSCGSPQKHTAHFFAFDTLVDVTIYTDSPEAERDIDSLKILCTRLEEQLSIAKHESEIYKINHRPDSMVNLSDTLKGILAFCRREYALSGGLFDVTVEPLKYLYGLESHQNENHVPSSAEIDSVMSLVGFDKIRFQSDGVSILPHGMHLDFGGIAKGFALIAAKKLLVSKGYERFMFNAGGDLVAVGCKPDKRPWIIGIQHPRASDKLVATIRVTDQSVFTSGDYERFFIQDGIRYHHLFNPKTGVPGRCNSSATVISTDPLAADAAVKTAFLMPALHALDYLTSRNMPGLLVDSSGIGWTNAAMNAFLKPEPGFIVNFK